MDDQAARLVSVSLFSDQLVCIRKHFYVHIHTKAVKHLPGQRRKTVLIIKLATAPLTFV